MTHSRAPLSEPGICLKALSGLITGGRDGIRALSRKAWSKKRQRTMNSCLRSHCDNFAITAISLRTWVGLMMA